MMLHSKRAKKRNNFSENSLAGTANSTTRYDQAKIQNVTLQNLAKPKKPRSQPRLIIY